MKTLISILAFIISLNLAAQIDEPLAMLSNSGTDKGPQIADTAKKKLFSNSDAPGVSFIVSSDVAGNELYIETNYAKKYKVRFIQHSEYGYFRKVFKEVYSDATIDISDFEKSIFIMNIHDSESHKLLTTQVINLKRRHL
jgi:hypothetical protein